MPAKGKHRRPKNSPLTRRFVAAGTGGAALALPMLGATGAEAATPSAAHALTAAAPAAVTPAAATHTVAAGESLSKIAREHGVSGGWKKLYEDNRKAVGADPSLIRPGLKLTIGAKAKAPAARSASERADRSAERSAPAAKAATYPDNLDGWIREALDVMGRHGIPGSYEGIHRNIMRESSGNPFAINNWDINAVNGTPSKGLLQVIAPTFEAYHVPGTANDAYDPVANIVAACNYAADRYGSIDNVNGPY
ncbi:LysM peptidoglycan-binding domain-containing protein [Streptomyces sp. CB03238]|uniref:transglycosylase SLT domain-containing protein n=1 Tax=Streptomyces sp. CB03238 TaxID=1907777 RepID=UPI000A0FB745|nr:LysM peptidoglycan-binding domain-containing protein [Streptomyces sp. CB03238]ORT60641.1 peptidoglycan-binding protein [Streptomyces sp. CB03238]